MAKKKVFSIGNALSNGLEETITAAHSYSGQLRIEIIPLRKIEVDPDNPRDLLITFEDLYDGISTSDPQFIRKKEERDDLETLSISIKEQGILNPIIVYKQGEKYRLIAGERRTLASIMAGKYDIQAKILDAKPSPLKISLLQWIENIERSDLTLWHRIKNLEKIVSAYCKNKAMPEREITLNELSQLLGCTKPHAINYKAVLFSDSLIQNLIKENKIKNLEKAALISNIENSTVRQHVLTACLSGASLKKLKMVFEQSEKQSLKQEAQKNNRGRGRESTAVNFGMTKNRRVAKMIIDSVLKHHSLSHLTHYFEDTNWNDYKSMTDAFKQIVLRLEDLH